MALRVLLADESSTIKKVMQLALQDFGVEVKAVSVGLDVVQVARSFQPDIIFADVMLTKRSGYEVSADLKADSSLRQIPVVLMWSSFMEFDEKKGALAKSDARIEKPFDAETLREIVRKLVPQTSSNVISNYLSFPELPQMIEDGKAGPTETPALEMVDLKDFDEPEEFQQVPLQATGKQVSHQDDWSHQDLSKFKLDIPQENFNLEVDEADLTRTSIALSSGAADIALDDIDSAPAKTNIKKPVTKETGFSSTFGSNDYSAVPSRLAPSAKGLDVDRADQIMREESRAVIEAIAWKVIPDLAERIVREEIQKLLKDAERI